MPDKLTAERVAEIRERGADPDIDLLLTEREVMQGEMNAQEGLASGRKAIISEQNEKIKLLRGEIERLEPYVQHYNDLLYAYNELVNERKEQRAAAKPALKGQVFEDE